MTLLFPAIWQKWKPCVGVAGRQVVDAQQQQPALSTCPVQQKSWMTGLWDGMARTGDRGLCALQLFGGYPWQMVFSSSSEGGRLQGTDIDQNTPQKGVCCA